MKGVAHCFAGCYSGDIVGLIERLRGANRLLARASVLESFDFDNQVDSSIVYSNGREDFIDSQDWFTKQGFSFRTAYYWRIEFNKTSLTFPIRNVESKTIGFITRNIVAFPKYILSKGFKKEVLFGINFAELNKPLIVSEGVFDCMWLWQLGFNNVSLLGAHPSMEQIAQLKELNVGWFIFDDDIAGRQAVEYTSKFFPKSKFILANIRQLNQERIMEVL